MAERAAAALRHGMNVQYVALVLIVLACVIAAFSPESVAPDPSPLFLPPTPGAAIGELDAERLLSAASPDEEYLGAVVAVLRQHDLVLHVQLDGVRSAHDALLEGTLAQVAQLEQLLAQHAVLGEAIWLSISPEGAPALRVEWREMS